MSFNETGDADNNLVRNHNVVIPPAWGKCLVLLNSGYTHQ